MAVKEILETMGLDPSKFCLTLDGVVEVDKTTMDKYLRSNRVPVGHGCYKVNANPGRQKVDNSNSSHTSKP